MLNRYRLKYSMEINSDFQTILSILIYEIQPEEINSVNINNYFNIIGTYVLINVLTILILIDHKTRYKITNVIKTKCTKSFGLRSLNLAVELCRSLNITNEW